MPVVSEAQRGKFGAELRRRERGLTPRMSSMSTAKLRESLAASKGAKLPQRSQAPAARKARSKKAAAKRARRR